VADVTYLDAGRLHGEAAAADADVAFAMDEDAFRAFYDRTSGPLWGYLSRLTGDRQAADDLLQEAYYRLLKSGVEFENEAHRRNYLYRVATNLVHDSRRGARPLFETGVEIGDIPARAGYASPEQRADVRRALGRLKSRERAMLWLAYAHGSSHSEIAAVLGVKTASIKLLLFRARRKLAGLLQKRQGESS
jgi:RNA polymerase sigma-70 factor, ECF subfamily